MTPAQLDPSGSACPVCLTTAWPMMCCMCTCRLHVHLLDEAGSLLGSLEPLVPGSGGGLAKMRKVMSFCSRFDGTYTDKEGRRQVVDVGGKYRFKVSLQGPLTAADADRNVAPRVDAVSGLIHHTVKVCLLVPALSLSGNALDACQMPRRFKRPCTDCGLSHHQPGPYGPCMG